MVRSVARVVAGRARSLCRQSTLVDVGAFELGPRLIRPETRETAAPVLGVKQLPRATREGRREGLAAAASFSFPPSLSFQNLCPLPLPSSSSPSAEQRRGKQQHRFLGSSNCLEQHGRGGGEGPAAAGNCLQRSKWRGGVPLQRGRRLSLPRRGLPRSEFLERAPPHASPPPTPLRRCHGVGQRGGRREARRRSAAAAFSSFSLALSLFLSLPLSLPLSAPSFLLFLPSFPHRTLSLSEATLNLLLLLLPPFPLPTTTTAK